MRIFLSARTVLFLFVLKLFICDSALAGAFDNPVIGLKATGMGFAMAGIADDASAVHYNPAGLPFQQRGVWHTEVYGYCALTDIQYEANGITDKSDDIFIIPGFFASKTYENWAIGFGMYVPYAGGGASYDNFQGSSNVLECAAGWNAITVSVGRRLAPNLAIGGGMSAYVGEITNKFYDLSLGEVVSNEYTGYSGFGGHIGMLYKPVKDIGIGVTIRSEVPIKMDGRVRIAGAGADSEVEFTLPYYFTLGIGCSPVERFTLGLSATYMLWGDLDKMTFTTTGVRTHQLTSYVDSWKVSFGMEYNFENNFTIRTGANFRQSSTETDGLVPVSSDVGMVGIRVGGAYNITESMEINLIGLKNFGFDGKYNGQKFKQDGAFIMCGVRMTY